MEKNRKSNITYYLLSSLIATIYSVLNSSSSVEEFVINFIVPFAGAAFFAIPIQIISPKTSWPKILFWTMLFVSLAALFGDISHNDYV